MFERSGSIGSGTRAVCVAICVAMGAGCATPEFVIAHAPPIELYLDGRRTTVPRTAGDREMPLPYYGTTVLSGRRRPSKPDSTELLVDWRDKRAEFTVDEPFSPWLFPFDFVLECLTYPFASDERYRHATSIALERRPLGVTGLHPRDLAEIRARAKAARVER